MSSTYWGVLEHLTDREAECVMQWCACDVQGKPDNLSRVQRSLHDSFTSEAPSFGIVVHLRFHLSASDTLINVMRANTIYVHKKRRRRRTKTRVELFVSATDSASICVPKTSVRLTNSTITHKSVCAVQAPTPSRLRRRATVVRTSTNHNTPPRPRRRLLS